MSKNQPRYIIIHCTDVSYKTMPDQFYAVNRWHKERDFGQSSLGWYVGYHRLSSNGIEYKAREDWEVGSHCNQFEEGNSLSYNFYSLGYCIAFDGDVELPLQNDIENLVKTVRVWMTQYNIPLENIIYHRKPTPWKTCPGALVPEDYFKNLIRITPPAPPKEDEQALKAAKIKLLYQLLDQLRALVEKLKQQLWEKQKKN